jgi:hypothetical protein
MFLPATIAKAIMSAGATATGAATPMKLFESLLALAMLAAPLPALADGGWIGADGQALPDTPWSKSKDGFAAMLLITPDQDWEQKWDTPTEVTPHFAEASEVSAGGRLAILSFLSNPMLDAAGRVNVTCDVRITRPDGTRAIDESNVPCFAGKLETPPRNVYLTGAVVNFIEEPEEPRGAWQVDITVRDTVRGVAIPLQAGFEVK